MKARALGRFLAELLEGFLDATPEAVAEKAPVVVPVQDVRNAVAEFLKPLIEEQDAPQQQNLFDDRIMEAAPPGDRGEDVVARVREARERAAEQARYESGMPPDGWIDPNMPGSTSWTSPKTA